MSTSSSSFPSSASSPPSSSSSSPSSVWLVAYMKLKFFTRIRRFLRSKAPHKRNRAASDHHAAEKPRIIDAVVDDDEEEKKDTDKSMVFQKSVKRLHFGTWEEKEMAAEQIQRLARDDVSAKKLIAELGVIPVLVSMVAADESGRRRAAIKALLELANGTYTNKALIVDAGLYTKLPKNIEEIDESTRQEFAELISSLCSLANTQSCPSSYEIISFLISILESKKSSIETKEVSLGALYKLSIVLENAGALISNGVVQTLLMLSLEKQLSEKALAILGHLVVTLMGKKAMEENQMVPERLIEIFTWEEKSKCQELSVYILMILAHQSSTQRAKMARAGIVPVLVKVSLLGSPLAQKRATKLLQWFKDERQAKMGPHSGPQTGRISIGSPCNPREAEEGKKMMKNLVKQSLYKNLEMITQRAASPSSSNLKSFAISTSSKSLPY